MLKKISFFLLVILCINFISPCYAITIDIYNDGKSNIVMDVKTGRILYEKNIYEKLPMASTTKIMTALLAIENIPMNKRVKVNPKAEGIEGSSIYLKANEEIKMVDLVYGLMLRSGNDAAEAIAYEISGSIEDFVKLMNMRAKQIGVQNTLFQNPHGLHNDNHYTTAYDLALITRAALKNEIFREVVKTKFWLADREGYKHFANKNKTLDMCEGGDGVKIGYTKKAGRCLVSSATRNNMQLIAVTLKDGDYFNTTKTLLDYSFEKYKPYVVFEEGDMVKNIMISGGTKDTVDIRAPRKLIIPVEDGESEKVISIIQLPEVINAPILKGEKIGNISTYLNGKLINITELSIDEDINKLTVKEKILKFFKQSKF